MEKNLKQYIELDYSKKLSAKDTIKRDNKKKRSIRTVSIFTKVKKNKIIFINFTGSFECNVKAIANKLIEMKAPVDLVWASNWYTNIAGNNFPKEIRVLDRNTYDFFKELSSAKIIIDNSINMAELLYKKKRNQILIETWHGSLGIKKFGRQANNDEKWHKNADKEAKQTNYIISNSDFEDDIYRSTFWKKTKILKYGHARNDVFFKKEFDKDLKTKICKKYDIPEQNKLCLYAPTFRDNGDIDLCKLDFKKLADSLSKRFGGKWTILFRYHDATRRQFWDSSISYPENIVNVSDYPDIYELASIIDAGITDYSSWICEYLLRKKPGFLYVPDYKYYVNTERPLLLDIDEFPFSHSLSEEELNEKILEYNEDDYISKCSAFINKCGSIDDGYAAERICKKIIELLKIGGKK